MKNIKYYITPIIIFLSSFLLRLSLISKGPFHTDCLHLAQKAELTLSTLKLHSLFGSGYPLTVIFGAIFIFFAKVFGINDPVLAVNFMSVFFSSICILVIYFIALNSFDSIAAKISATLLALHPIFMEISLYGKSHAPAMFFLLLGILFLLYWKEQPSIKFFVASSLSLGLMGACRLQDLVLMIIPISFLIYCNNNFVNTVKRLLLFWAFALGLTTLFHLPLFINTHSNGYSNQLSSFFSMSLFNNFSIFDHEPIQRTIIYIYRSSNYLGIIIALLWLIYASRKKNHFHIFIVLWFTIPLLFYGNINTTASRFLSLIIPAFVLTQSHILSRLYKFNLATKAMVIFLIFFVGVSPFMKVATGLLIRHQNALLPEYTRWLKSIIENNAVVITTDDQHFYIHYGKITILRRPSNKHQIKKAAMLLLKEKIDHLLENNVPVYFTSFSLFSYNPDMAFSSFVLDNYKLLFVDSRLCEFWHHGILYDTTYKNHLYKVEPK